MALSACGEGVLAAPPPQPRSNLVAGLGSDHVPLVVDVALCTPVVKAAKEEAEIETRQNGSTMLAANISAGTVQPMLQCHDAINGDMVDMLRKLEHKLAMLEESARKPALVVELKWALFASTFTAIFAAASTLCLGLIQFIRSEQPAVYNGGSSGAQIKWQ